MAQFDIIGYYAKWDDPVYKNYITLINDLFSFNPELALEKVILSTSYEVNINDSIYIIKNPKYINIDAKLKELVKELNDVQRKHMSITFDTQQKNILDFIHALQYYKALILNNLVKRQPNHNEDLFNNIYNNRADTSQLVKRYVDDHVAYLNNVVDMNDIKTLIYIESLPSVEFVRKEEQVKEKVKKIPKEKIPKEPKPKLFVKIKKPDPDDVPVVIKPKVLKPLPKKETQKPVVEPESDESDDEPVVIKPKVLKPLPKKEPKKPVVEPDESEESDESDDEPVVIKPKVLKPLPKKEPKKPVVEPESDESDDEPVIIKPKVLKKTLKKDSNVKSPLQRLLEDSPFGKFAFNQREDCKSKERKQKYYMTKEEILKVIDSLKKEDREKLPKALKSLTKEKICDLLFEGKKN